MIFNILVVVVSAMHYFYSLIFYLNLLKNLVSRQKYFQLSESFFISFFFSFMYLLFYILVIYNSRRKQKLVKMGKRTIDHETNFDTPNNKKRKIENHNTATFTTPQTNELSFVLTTETVDGVVLTDLCRKKWRCGKPIGMHMFYILIRSK